MNCWDQKIIKQTQNFLINIETTKTVAMVRSLQGQNMTVRVQRTAGFKKEVRSTQGGEWLA